MRDLSWLLPWLLVGCHSWDGADATDTGGDGAETEVSAADGDADVGADADADVGADADADVGADADADVGADADADADAVVLLGVAGEAKSLESFPPLAGTTSGDWYVDGRRDGSGDGRSPETAFRTLDEGLAALSSGETLLVLGGTYVLSAPVVRATAWAAETRVMGYGDDRPVLDAAGVAPNTGALQFSSDAANETWHRFHVRNVPDRGDGYDGQAVRVLGATGITLSDLWVSHCAQDGIWFFGARDCVVQDCAVWRLGDGETTGTNVPDGYAATANSGEFSENVWFVRSFAANAGDDGFDLFRARESGVLDSVAYGAGRYWSGGPAGDGNGFKMGGATGAASNGVAGCLALGCRANGIDGNQGEFLAFTQNTSVDNGALGFDLNGDVETQRHQAYGNIAFGNPTAYYAGPFVTHESNTWNLGIDDPGFADPELFDWSLGPGSRAVGAGHDGGNLGASDVALRLAKHWLAQDLR